MPDPHITREAQELFEQFSDVHGTLNEDETELLATMEEVTEETVGQWCKYRLDLRMNSIG